ncbi:SNF2 family N-terminal domain-containing protein [Tribonema minus]|uniref:SNF2 family N-terminal domain-containing protein n=1 Tax=Tribonema minus TaxID=303371 RepID=A0A835Z4M3_9STRA|nr:SNF2 family N-terminal domain-containing protein [Tribonema minus]
MLRRDTLPAAVARALPADVTLRPYQWEGVTWCDFLRRTGTNGVLADEMGLGKTLQALLACAICRAHSGDTAAPALVICPPTLVHHWQAEATRFLGAFFSHILVYAGIPAKRKQLATQFAAQALVVTSYPVVQRDWSTLSQSRWSYLILDEAHLLRNPNSAVAGAVRALHSDHRLALTGTPIQNTVAEVWAIFDLVMPGYLGERSDFKSSYVTPTRAVLESGGRVGGVGEVLEGMRVLDRLHRQVLPFVLRREKAQVLADLPPKIITDMACEMPPRQRQAYEQLCRAMRQGGAAAEQGDKREVFEWLTLQQLACVHPALVLNKTQPATGADAKTVAPAASMPLGDSCKLLALRQLLWDCGIGLQDCSDGSDADAEGVQQQLQRKCLVFAQHKAALDAAEQCLLRQHLPSVKYLRIDGSIGQDARAAVLERFTSDAAVSLLLLTTAVGGLGLNLTVADTVIFLEHHWNPQVDLQAMDRAHRIGQRRAVNVYRLVATGTVEERILLLQAGKLATAEKVVGKDNASLWSLDTDSVLQLFNAAIDASGAADGSSAASNDGAAAEERQLQDEYASFDAERFAVSVQHLDDS